VLVVSVLVLVWCVCVVSCQLSFRFERTGREAISVSVSCVCGLSFAWSAGVKAIRIASAVIRIVCIYVLILPLGVCVLVVSSVRL
jgi:hypothetical protein